LIECNPKVHLQVGNWWYGHGSNLLHFMLGLYLDSIIIPLYNLDENVGLSIARSWAFKAMSKVYRQQGHYYLEGPACWCSWSCWEWSRWGTWFICRKIVLVDSSSRLLREFFWFSFWTILL
jgi:hypothetical protein